MKTLLTLALASVASLLSATRQAPTISGHYVEVRSCDVYTGSCVANAEMNLSGREGLLAWSVQRGAWNGTKLDGLNVVVALRTENTLGDIRYEPRDGRAVLLVDDRATAAQRAALIDFVRASAGPLVRDIVEVKSVPMHVTVGQCKAGACAQVKAGDLVEISTRCLGGQDHLCGNEENYYPPLTEVRDAISAYTELAAYRGRALNATWELVGKRSAYLATFSR